MIDSDSVSSYVCANFKCSACENKCGSFSFPFLLLTMIPHTVSGAEDHGSLREGLEGPSSVCNVQLGSSSACEAAKALAALATFGPAGELADGGLEAILVAREDD